MRRGQADDDILNFTHRVRGARIRIGERYIATGVEMVLAAAAFKFVASYARGRIWRRGSHIGNPRRARNDAPAGKIRYGGEAKRILIEQGVPNPTDSQVMDVSKGHRRR